VRYDECRGSLPCLGLIQEIVRQSCALGLTHWAAVMEPKLLRMLAQIGFHFTPVGPLVSYHGLRQPSYASIPETLERLKRERPDHWMVVTDAGALMPAERRGAARRAA
jgi:N-acyl amino acid synthase of PEP-CTERM/exosortase system